MLCPKRLSRPRVKALKQLHEVGHVRHFHGAGVMQRNRPYWALVELGLAEFDFGPRGQMFTTYCFMPLWSDPVC